MSNLRAALTIAAKDLRQRIRDRSFIVLGVVAPLALALIFNLIMGDLDVDSFDLRYAVVDEDGGAVATQLVAGLEQIEAEGVFMLESGSRTDIEQRVEAGELAAMFVIPDGFTEAVTSGTPATLEVVGSVDAPTSTAIAAAIARGFSANVRAVQLSVATAMATGSTEDPTALAATAATAGEPIALGEVEAATRQLDLATFFIVGMAIFFLFFTVAFGVTSLLEERTEGTMARLAAAPVSRWAILAGKAIVSGVLGIVSMAVLVVASTLIMGADWGDPVGVTVLIVAAVISAMGLMAVVAAFAKTAEQAGNLQAIIAVGLGMLGGVFFPANLGDGLFARLAYISPHRWFVTGLSELAGGDTQDILLHAAALVAVGVVAVLVAAPRLKKAVVA